MGNNAGMSNSSGNNNVILGKDAGKFYDGSFGNVLIGEETAMNLSGGQRNVMIGYSAGEGPVATYEGNGNVFVGSVAGRYVDGDYNVIIGEAAGENVDVPGGSNGSSNVFLGKDAGRFATGSSNIYIGDGSGMGSSLTPNKGSNNIYLGRASWADTLSYRMSIGSTYGSLLYGKLDNTKQLVVDGDIDDNNNNRTFFVNGSAGGTTAWYNDSDERLKKNIRTVDNALDKVMKLRGVTYEWKDPEKHEKGRKLGFIAQESKEVIPEAVDYNIENDSYSMQYASVTAVLVEAIKELKKEVGSSVAALENKEIESKKVIDGQNDKINILMNENKELKNKLNELESLRAEIEQIKSLISNYAVK
jgi:hypothetical protein